MECMTIKIKCDNAAVVAIINSGRSKNTGQQLQLGETKQRQQMDLRDLMKSANKTFWKTKLNKALQLADVQSGCWWIALSSLLQFANQVVQRCKLPYVVLVNALYGLGQFLLVWLHYEYHNGYSNQVVQKGFL